MNKNFLIENDKNNDEIKQIMDEKAIEKGNFIKTIKKYKKEFDKEVKELRNRITDEIEKYNGYK